MRATKDEGRFEGPDDDLLASLRDALRSEPLPPALSQRIRAEFEQRVQSRHPLGLPLAHVGGLVAAACLIVAVMLPWGGPRPAEDAGAAIRLSQDDAAAIVAAYGLLSWDNPSLEYMLEAVDASLDDLGRDLRGEGSRTGTPPWEDDAWDVPTERDEGTSWQPGSKGVPVALV